MNPFTFNVELYHQKMVEIRQPKANDLLQNLFPQRHGQHSTSSQHPLLQFGKRVLGINSSKRVAVVGTVGILTFVCMKKLVKVLRKTSKKGSEAIPSQAHNCADELPREETLLQSLSETDIASPREATAINSSSSEVEPVFDDDSSCSSVLSICSVLALSVPPTTERPGNDHYRFSCSKKLENEAIEPENAETYEQTEVNAKTNEELINQRLSVLQDPDEMPNNCNVAIDSMKEIPQQISDDICSLETSTDGGDHPVSDMPQDSLILKAIGTGNTSPNHETRNSKSQKAGTRDRNRSTQGNWKNPFTNSWIFNPAAPPPSLEEFHRDFKAFIDNGRTPGISDHDFQKLISPSKGNHRTEEGNAEGNKLQISVLKKQTGGQGNRNMATHNILTAHQWRINEHNQGVAGAQDVRNEASDTQSSSKVGRKRRNKYRKRGMKPRKNERKQATSASSCVTALIFEN